MLPAQGVSAVLLTILRQERHAAQGRAGRCRTRSSRAPASWPAIHGRRSASAPVVSTLFRRRLADGTGLSRPRVGLGQHRLGLSLAVAAQRPADLCDSGSWAGRRPSLGGYVTGTGARRGATATGGCKCWLSSVAAASGAASVRVRHITSRGWDPWTERPLPEGVRVAYPRTKIIVATASALENC